MARRRRKGKSGGRLRWAIGAILFVPALYLLAALIGSLIPVNRGWTEPAEGTTIYLADNGVHADIVMPIAALGRATVGTGLRIALPAGSAALVLPRSGLAAKHGITIVNAPGLVDAGYRGEIRVTLLNTDATTSYDVAVGDRIAQLLVLPLPEVAFVPVVVLPGSHRAERGFGSTGVGDQPAGAALLQGEDQPREHLLEPDGVGVEVLGGVEGAEAPGGQVEPAVHVDRRDADSALPEPGGDPPGHVALAGAVDSGDPR